MIIVMVGWLVIVFIDGMATAINSSCQSIPAGSVYISSVHHWLAEDWDPQPLRIEILIPQTPLYHFQSKGKLVASLHHLQQLLKIVQCLMSNFFVCVLSVVPVGFFEGSFGWPSPVTVVQPKFIYSGFCDTVKLHHLYTYGQSEGVLMVDLTLGEKYIWTVTAPKPPYQPKKMKKKKKG